MTVEWLILVCVWVVSAALLFFIPTDKRRLAHAAILFKQVITWIAGLLVVEKGWLQYPVREFSKVNRTSLTFEYLAYPIVCGLFNSHYPENRSLFYKCFYYFTYCSVITIIEVLIEKNTDLIVYNKWEWYWTWSTLFLTFFLSRKFCKWFFRS